MARVYFVTKTNVQLCSVPRSVQVQSKLFLPANRSNRILQAARAAIVDIRIIRTTCSNGGSYAGDYGQEKTTLDYPKPMLECLVCALHFIILFFFFECRV